MRQWLRPVVALLLAAAVSTSCTSDPAPEKAPNADLLRLGVDSRTPIESRIGDVPSEITNRNAEFGLPPWTNYSLSEAERKKVVSALQSLTPLQTGILREHLRSISFVNGMSNNAQTVRVMDANGLHSSFDIVLRAGLLNETISEFATRKERQLFDATGSTLSVSVEAGSMDAIVFVLLHEATHIVDSILRLTPAVAPGFAIPEGSQTRFSRGVWEASNKPSAPYQGTLLEGAFFRTGKALPIAEAEAFYDELKRTPFSSSYASSTAGEDLAELVALWRLTEKYRQPFRIVIRDSSRVVYSYEPMKSELVRSRLPQLARFSSTAVD